MAGHKSGSNVLTTVTGIALVGLGIAISANIDIKPKAHPAAVNGGACILFGIVLLWWVVGEGKKWGIGFETVTMTVAVVTAVIAILTLTT